MTPSRLSPFRVSSYLTFGQQCVWRGSLLGLSVPFTDMVVTGGPEPCCAAVLLR